MARPQKSAKTSDDRVALIPKSTKNIFNDNDRSITSKENRHDPSRSKRFFFKLAEPFFVLGAGRDGGAAVMKITPGYEIEFEQRPPAIAQNNYHTKRLRGFKPTSTHDELATSADYRRAQSSSRPVPKFNRDRSSFNRGTIKYPSPTQYPKKTTEDHDLPPVYMATVLFFVIFLSYCYIHLAPIKAGAVTPDYINTHLVPMKPETQYSIQAAAVECTSCQSGASGWAIQGVGLALQVAGSIVALCVHLVWHMVRFIFQVLVPRLWQWLSIVVSEVLSSGVLGRGLDIVWQGAMIFFTITNSVLGGMLRSVVFVGTVMVPWMIGEINVGLSTMMGRLG